MMTEHKAFYLGCLPNVTILYASQQSPSSRSQPVDENASFARPPEIQLIERIENAQLANQLPYTVPEEAIVRLCIDKHGLRISDAVSTEVFERHPLHTVSQAVCFDNAQGRYNVGITVGQVGKNHFVCHVFQTMTKEQAEAICKCLQNSFVEVNQNHRQS